MMFLFFNSERHNKKEAAVSDKKPIVEGGVSKETLKSQRNLIPEGSGRKAGDELEMVDTNSKLKKRGKSADSGNRI